MPKCACPVCPVWLFKPPHEPGPPRRYCCDACRQLAYRLRLGRSLRDAFSHHSADCLAADPEHFRG